MTTTNTQYTLYYNTTVHIEEYENLSEMTFRVQNFRALPSDLSIADYEALAKFIDQIQIDLTLANKAVTKAMNQVNISMQLNNLIIEDTDGTIIQIAYSIKKTKKKISRRMSINQISKEWDELLPPRYSN